MTWEQHHSASRSALDTNYQQRSLWVFCLETPAGSMLLRRKAELVCGDISVCSSIVTSILGDLFSLVPLVSGDAVRGQW
jgi:hypothetical protein